MKISYIKIPKILEKINKDHLIIPHLQRNYIWKDKNIYAFLDSIMRIYPFPTFYFWNKKKEISARKLIKDYEIIYEKSYITDTKLYKGGNKWLILDGQQRIQSLFISLMGSKEKKEMYLDVTNNNSKIFMRDGSFSLYNFKFLNPSRTQKTGYINIKELYKAIYKEKVITKHVVESLYKHVTKWKELIDYAKENDLEDTIMSTITIFHKAFTESEFSYELIEDEDRDEEVFNIFTRINNGGIKLTYADIIFIYFKTFWPEAQNKFADILDKIPKGFSVDYEFLIKTSITLIKNSCEFDIAKINKNFVNNLKDNKNWKKFKDSIITAFEALHKIYIYDNSTLRSNISLIPVIYAIYYNKIKYAIDSENFLNELKKYIYITNLKDTFSAKPESVVNKIINNYLKTKKFEAKNILALIIGANYNINKYDIDSVIGQRNTKLILNLIYYQEDSFLIKKNSSKFKLDIDHIYPESDCKDYYEEKNKYNNILNYCYLSGEKNRKLKMRTPPDRFFKKQDINKHLFPFDKIFKYSVGEKDSDFVKNFDKFKKARLKLILEKINKELK